jgi:hypothetical protein
MVEELKQIAGLFLEERITDVQPVTGGLINSTYKVQTEQNQCVVLQKINTNVFPDVHAIQVNIQRVGEFLQQSGYPKEILMPIHAKSGASFYLDAQSGAWRMLPYIGNTVCHQALPHLEVAQHAAGALGELHGYLSKMSADELIVHLPDFINFKSRLLQFEQTLASAYPERLSCAEKEIDQLKGHLRIVEHFVHVQEILPKRIIHGDPKLSNFLFQKDGVQVVAMIDLDTLMPGTVLYDFGDMVRSFCNPKGEESMQENGFNSQIYKAIKDAYVEKTTDFLTPIEKQSLDLAAAAVIAVQALRFLNDYLNGDVYYQIDHPRHNLQRAQNQLQLLQAFLEKVQLVLPVQ